jgi:Na+/melibiose symporter-like transporter
MPEVFVEWRSLVVVFWVYAVGSFVGFVASLVYFGVERKFEDRIDGGVDEEKEDEGSFGLRDFRFVGALSKLYIVIVGFSCVIYYMFTSFGTDFLMVYYNMSYLDAKNKIALLPLITTLTTPIWSIIISKYGKKTIFLICASLLVTAAHFSWHLIPASQAQLTIFPILALGAYLAMYNSLSFVALGHSLPKQALTTGIGLACSLSNLMLMAFPLAMEFIVKNRTKGEYLVFSDACFGTGVVLTVLSVVALVLDFKAGGLLHLPENSEKAVEMRKRAESYKSLGKVSNGMDKLKD